MKKNLFALLWLVVGLSALVIVGSMDYTDAVREQVLYCDNVANKVWPDYEGSYSTECTAEKLKEYQEILR